MSLIKKAGNYPDKAIYICLTEIDVYLSQVLSFIFNGDINILSCLLLLCKENKVSLL